MLPVEFEQTDEQMNEKNDHITKVLINSRH